MRKKKKGKFCYKYHGVIFITSVAAKKLPFFRVQVKFDIDIMMVVYDQRYALREEKLSRGRFPGAKNIHTRAKL
jgi:hypothetical protein